MPLARSCGFKSTNIVEILLLATTKTRVQVGTQPTSWADVTAMGGTRNVDPERELIYREEGGGALS